MYIRLYLHSYIHIICILSYVTLNTNGNLYVRMYVKIYRKYVSYGTVTGTRTDAGTGTVTGLYVSVGKSSFQRNTTDSAKIISVRISNFKKNIVRHRIITYVRTYICLVLVRLQTKPKPYHKPVCFWFGFEAKPASKTPNLNQKTNQCFCTLQLIMYANVEAVFINIWFVFGSNLVPF